MTHMPFKKLAVWQKALDLASSIYDITDAFPTSEQYGLVAQMRRAAVSVVSNIAEGSQRGTDRDFAHFISVSRGSLAELETQLLLSHRRSYIQSSATQSLEGAIDELGKMLNALQRKLNADR
jgi:four helix bundle protein